MSIRISRILVAVQCVLIMLLVPAGRAVEAWARAIIDPAILVPIGGSVGGLLVAAWLIHALRRLPSPKPTVLPKPTVFQASMLLLILIQAAVLVWLVRLPVEAAHVPLFGLLAIFLFQSRFFTKAQQNVATALVFCIAFSFFDEFLQWLHPLRVFDYRDIAINVISSCFGLSVYVPFRSSLKPNSSDADPYTTAAKQ